MHRTRIKFCGITREKDAASAAVAGADAIGLIFYEKSSRCVSIDQAREILFTLPPMVCPVGLFVNSTVEQILSTARELNLRTVQLHGEETPEMVGELTGLSVIKAVRCEAGSFSKTLQIWRSGTARLKLTNLSGILLETGGTPEPGGTGIENDWSAIAAVIGPGQITRLPPLIAAGGLTPENVGNVVRRLRPWAVDVSTGIEQAPGVKSLDKMRRFAAAVHVADLSWTE